MYTGTKTRKTYSHVAAIQIGYLLDKRRADVGRRTRRPRTARDQGAITVHLDKLVAACDDMMKTVAGIKARGDEGAAEELFAKYVDSSAVVPTRDHRRAFSEVPEGELRVLGRAVT